MQGPVTIAQPRPLEVGEDRNDDAPDEPVEQRRPLGAGADRNTVYAHFDCSPVGLEQR